MSNPTEEGTYTTIFKDGTIIHYNYWMMFEDGKGKWYWNSTVNGGVIHWFKPGEDYIMHKNYKLPDWELREILAASFKYEAIKEFCDKREKIFTSYLIEHGFDSFEKMADNEMNAGYYKGYEIKE